MGFQVITDMKQADELWEAGLLYYWDQFEWCLDDYFLRGWEKYDWRPSADVAREGSPNKYAIFVED